MSRARVGKVARLPVNIREEINSQLLDGKSGPQIISWLKTRDVTDITVQNLSEWRQGGYQDWLKSSTQMDRIRERAELSLRMAQAAGGSLGESMVMRLAGKIDERIDALSDDDLKTIRPVLDTILFAEKLKLEKRKVEQRSEVIEITRQKFQRDTAEIFVKWSEDEEIKAILKSKGDKEVKMDLLVKRIWGDRPESPATK